MSREPRHRRLRRTHGFRLFDGRGRRRQTREPEELDRYELARQADRAASLRARRRVVAALAGALLIVAAAVIVTVMLLDDRRPTPEVGSPREEGTAYLALVTDESARATSIALVAVRADGPAQVVLFPPALLVTIPGYGDGPLQEAVRFEGPELAELTVSNLLGVRVHGSLMFPPGSLAEAVAEPLSVELTVPLIVREDDGERVAAAAGAADRDGGLLHTLLTVQGTSDQLDWLQRQGDVWRALLRAAGDEPELARRLAANATGASEPAAEVVASAGRADELLVTAVPVSRIAVGGDTERYQLSGEDASAFVDGRVGYLRSGEEPRTRVEVLNGNGRVGTTRVVAEALIERGFRVVKTDNAANFDYQTTEVIAQGRANQQPALAVQEILGRGEVVLELRRPSGVVDLTIIVGHDIPAEEG